MRPRHPRARRANLLAALAAAALVLPMSAHRAEAYDFSQGHYLTAEEYKKLSKDEAAQYCQQLAQEIDIQNDNATAASSQTAGLDATIAEQRARLEALKSANEQSAAAILEMEGQLKGPEKSAGTHTVVEGEWLMRIAGGADGYGDKSQWKRIFEANRDKISNPDLIYPGQELVVPR